MIGDKMWEVLQYSIITLIIGGISGFIVAKVQNRLERTRVRNRNKR